MCLFVCVCVFCDFEQTWSVEDHLFEIGVNSNPFNPIPATQSTSPIGIELEPNICHALKNIDSSTPAFFAAYFVKDPSADRPVPDKAVCRAQKKNVLE